MRPGVNPAWRGVTFPRLEHDSVHISTSNHDTIDPVPHDPGDATRCECSGQQRPPQTLQCSAPATVATRRDTRHHIRLLRHTFATGPLFGLTMGKRLRNFTSMGQRRARRLPKELSQRLASLSSCRSGPKWSARQDIRGGSE